MAIGTDATIWFFGTQDEVSTGTPSSVASGAFSDSDDTADWTNDDDAPWASAVIKYQYSTTYPTTGVIGLYAQLKDIQSTNDEILASASFHFLGAFAIGTATNHSANTDYWKAVPLFEVPQATASQIIRFHIKNEGTSQTIASGWQLWITPKTYGPHA